MSRGHVYQGSHTKIYLSEDGTIWPEDPHSRKDSLTKRWSVNGSQEIAIGDRPPNLVKAAKYRYLAILAKAYVSKDLAKKLAPPPPELWHAINAAGGIIEWINNDPKILERFWQMVEGQKRP